MENIILGDGITGYIIAACLDYNNEKFKIYGDGNYRPPAILLLKYKTKEELQHYFYIFGIEYNDENIKEYTKKIKIGYTSNNCKTILDEPNQAMINEYFQKQFRDCTKSSMSDGINLFYAIDLKKIYVKLKERYNKYFIDCDINDVIDDFKSNVNIYNTIFPTRLNNYKPSIEYICARNNDLKGYDYVYDCSMVSKVKRYTAKYEERISEGDYYDFKINNYYESPQIYMTFDPKSNVKWFDISRNATKTQLKQEDIINYLVKDE